VTTWSKRERLEAVLRGERADRLPVALWRHFPGDDQHPEDLARSQLVFQKEFDFDFIKVTPSSDFCVQDWDVDSVYEGNLEGTRRYVRRAVEKPEDWRRLPLLRPQDGALGRQLACLRLIGRGVEDDVPFIQTIFNPLSQARYLAGDDRLLLHLRLYPDTLLAGLETITQTTVAFVEQVCGTGAAGLFLALQHATYQLLNEDEYRRFGAPFDRRVLEALDQRAWFNVLHLHGSDVMFDLVSDYSVQAINWHDRETPPALNDALGRTRLALIGGLRQWETMVRGEPADVKDEITQAMLLTGGQRFIVGTGCVTPIVAPWRNVRAARETVDNLALDDH
jgi:uroporphyrinogen decarboxylase